MIYAIQAVGTEYVKFGITGHTSIKNRLAALQVGCPFELILLASCKWYDSDEQRIHIHLKDQRIRGEWFRLDEKAQSIVDAMIKSDREGFIGAFLARSTHKRLGAALDYCKDIAEQQRPSIRTATCEQAVQ